MVIQRKTGLVKRFDPNVFVHLSRQLPHVRGKYVSGWQNTVTFKLYLNTYNFHYDFTDLKTQTISDLQLCVTITLHESKYKLS